MPISTSRFPFKLCKRTIFCRFLLGILGIITCHQLPPLKIYIYIYMFANKITSLIRSNGFTRVKKTCQLCNRRILFPCLGFTRDSQGFYTSKGSYPRFCTRDPCVLQRHDAFGAQTDGGETAAKTPRKLDQRSSLSWMWKILAGCHMCMLLNVQGNVKKMYRITLFNVLFGESHGGGNKNIISLVG